MSPSPYNEDTLVQQTTADYLERQLSWESVYAHNHEDFGPDSLLGRTSEREVVLTRPLRAKLSALNPGLPDDAYDDAVRRITATAASQTIVAANREKYDLMRDGVQVTYRDEKGQPTKRRLRVLDFDDPTNNHFLCVREMWVRGDLYRRRPDIIGFVNGLPLLFIECKNIHRDLKAAFEKNYADYRDTVPHLFHHNAVVMFGNGEKARIGSITSRWGHFHEWKRLAEDDPGAVDMETLLKGVCDRRNFLDLVENFILFDESSGETRKILARNHQFLGEPGPRGGARAEGPGGEARRLLAHAGGRQELLDGDVHPQGAPQAGRQLHFPGADRPRRPRHPDLQDLRHGVCGYRDPPGNPPGCPPSCAPPVRAGR